MFHFRNTYIISADVGDLPNGKGNKAKDVLTIRSLLNAYARKKGLTPLLSRASTGVVVDDVFIERIKHFQKNIVSIDKPDGIVTKGAGTWKKLCMFLFNSYTVVSVTPPTKGLITWQVEGDEVRKYAKHSRSLHVPLFGSGLTLGRGYDMKEKTQPEIVNDLTAVGIDGQTAKRISLAAGLKSDAAIRFAVDHDLLDYEISAAVQLKLFDKSYAKKESYAKSVVTKSVYQKRHQTKVVEWSNLNQGIKTVLVDLFYRGDYRNESRSFLQVHIANNDLAGFKAALLKKSNWQGSADGKWKPVPDDRFKLRVKYLNSVPTQTIKKP